MIGWISLATFIDDLISAEDCGYGTSNADIVVIGRNRCTAAADRKDDDIIEPRTFMMVIVEVV